MSNNGGLDSASKISHGEYKEMYELIVNLAPAIINDI